jgi:hypothetical protein
MGTFRAYLSVLTAAVVVFVSTPAVPHVMHVPFFSDSAPNSPSGTPSGPGAIASIAVRNTLGQEVTMFLVYWQQDPAGEPVMQQAVSFELAAFSTVAFRPAADDPNEGAGRSVPNMLAGLGTDGGVDIIWIGGPEMASTLLGRYQQITSGSDFGYLLNY